MSRFDHEEWEKRLRAHHERHLRGRSEHHRRHWERNWERYRHAMNPVAWHVRRSLRRVIFWLLASTILMTGLLVSAVFHFASDGGWNYKRETDQVKTLAAHEFEEAWALPARRDAVARRMATDLDVDLAIKDAKGASLGDFGAAPCTKPQVVIPIHDGETQIGEVSACYERSHGRRPAHVFLPLLIFGCVLWAASGRLARRLARPYTELARVASEIGAGKLSARYTIRERGMDEARVLADAINDMAERIEKQMADQRELLAAVSHEIRTPLARIRLIAELLRGEAAGKGDGSVVGEGDASSTAAPTSGPSAFIAKALDDLDREVVEIDALVSELLASSRVDFAALRAHKLDAKDVAARALERAGLAPDLLVVRATDRTLSADATLLARALANLIANAEAHGGGVKGLTVRDTEEDGDSGIAFEVEDAGPGFPPGDEAKVFESFYRPATSTQAAKEKGSLGLGLTLVKRIAVAHGGTAFAENREGGGARVGIRIPRGTTG